MAVPNIFANATTTIPLAQLDQNFATTVTIGGASVALGNSIVDIPGFGNVTTTGNVTVGGNETVSGNVSVTGNVTASGASSTVRGQIISLASGSTGFLVGQTLTLASALTSEGCYILVVTSGSGSTSGTAGCYIITMFTDNSHPLILRLTGSNDDLTVAINGSNQVTVTNGTGGSRTIFAGLLRVG